MVLIQGGNILNNNFNLLSKLIFYLVCCLALCMSCFAHKQDVHRSSKRDSSEDESVNQVIKLIEACPAWSEISNKNAESSDKVIEYSRKISVYKTRIIRKAIKKFLLANERMDSTVPDTTYWSRIYVLNRYLFNVPDKAKIKTKTFGGWVGIPYTSKEVSMLWPLSYDIKGKLKLTGVYGGYLGHEYLAVEEFDYFYKKYGVRNNKH